MEDGAAENARLDLYEIYMEIRDEDVAGLQSARGCSRGSTPGPPVFGGCSSGVSIPETTQSLSQKGIALGMVA